LYTAEITVAAKDYDGADGCIFAAPLTAYVDGKEVSGAESSVTVNPDNTVTIRCAFRKGASGSWSEICAFTSQPKGGTAQAGESLRAAWTTNFVPDYFNVEYWDGEMWDQWDCLYAPASGEGDFGFESGVPQTVRFRVAAFIGDAAAAVSNEFTITWEPPVCTAQWKGDTCTVTRKVFEEGVSVFAAGYRDGRQVKAACLTAGDPTAVFNADNVKVFLLDGNLAPIREAMDLKP
ncbi:MAG: hypothetical protein K5981_07125, partial [Clostridia bacterium]|nr:hypothetical protein [Clostridia bacterium]